MKHYIDTHEAIELIRFLANELETATNWEKGYERKHLVAFAIQVTALLKETHHGDVSTHAQYY